MIITRWRRLVYLALTLVALPACSGWMGPDEDPPLPGTRIHALPTQEDRHGQRTQPGQTDVNMRALIVPVNATNSNWPTNLPNPRAEDTELSSRLWQQSVGAYEERGFFPEPIISNSTVYTIDIAGKVQAISLQNGQIIWQTNLARAEDDVTIVGGGLSLVQEDGEATLVATTGQGDVVAMDAQSGNQLWRAQLGVAIRSAPATSDLYVAVTDLSSRTFLLDLEDGRIIWSHQGSQNRTGLLGQVSPVILDREILVSYPFAAIHALNIETGRVLWESWLPPRGQVSALHAIHDVRAAPLVHRGRVFFTGYSNRSRALDLQNGRVIWEAPVGSVHGSWLAGGAFFLIDQGQNLVAVDAENGQILWQQELPVYENPQDRLGRISWLGPVVAGDQVWVAGSNGMVRGFTFHNGEPATVRQLGAGAASRIMVAENIILILDQTGHLSVYR